ncbi:MAG: VanZ family protein [Candidatus Rokubacteria bacterium]|nr:VanZ family protein [Candidatus Rokubacteria bacterium]
MTEHPRALRLLAPLGWTMVIAWFSGVAGNSSVTRELTLPWIAALLPWAAPETLEALHVLVRKTGHVTEYGLLAFLWAWAVGSWRAPLALSVLTAFLDEAHQATTLEREGSVGDLLLDSTAAAAALWLLHQGPGAPLDTLARALLWIAAGGGTALLLVNLTAGAPGGWLWLSVPAAWIALALLRMRTRRP